MALLAINAIMVLSSMNLANAWKLSNLYATLEDSTLMLLTTPVRAACKIANSVTTNTTVNIVNSDSKFNMMKMLA